MRRSRWGVRSRGCCGCWLLVGVTPLSRLSIPLLPLRRFPGSLSSPPSSLFSSPFPLPFSPPFLPSCSFPSSSSSSFPSPPPYPFHHRFLLSVSGALFPLGTRSWGRRRIVRQKLLTTCGVCVLVRVCERARALSYFLVFSRLGTNQPCYCCQSCLLVVS